MTVKNKNSYLASVTVVSTQDPHKIPGTRERNQPPPEYASSSPLCACSSRTEVRSASEVVEDSRDLSGVGGRHGALLIRHHTRAGSPGTCRYCQ